MKRLFLTACLLCLTQAVTVVSSPSGEAADPIPGIWQWRSLEVGSNQRLSYTVCPANPPGTWIDGIELKWDAILPGWDFDRAGGCGDPIRLDWGVCGGQSIACYQVEVWNPHAGHNDIARARIYFDNNPNNPYRFQNWGPNWQTAVSAHEWGHMLGLDHVGANMCAAASVMGIGDISKQASDSWCPSWPGLAGNSSPTGADRDSVRCRVYTYCNAPAATDYNQPGDGYHLNVYTVNSAGNLWENYYRANSESWSGWQGNLGGICTGSPAALAHGTNHLWVFCRGTDALIYGRRWDGGPPGGSGWGGWVQVLAQGEASAGFESGPAATEYYQPGDGYHLNVYARGWDGNVYENYYRIGTGAWSGWSSKGSPDVGCTSAPAADWRTNNELYVFCRGTDYAMWYRMWNGSSWGPWTTLFGAWTTAPAATNYQQPGDGWHINVYGVSTSRQIAEKYKSFGSWSGWSPGFEGECSTAAGASDLTSPLHLFVFCRGVPEPGDVWYRRWTGGGWDWWSWLGRPP